MNFGWPILYGGLGLDIKKTMKNWQKQRKKLEETIAIIGTVAAYERIPKEMPIKEWPIKLIEYHEQRLIHEAMPKDSPAILARQIRIDEIRRHK